MNPLIKELQNAEWSRVFGPTNTLGGELVRVEREVARMQCPERVKLPVRMKGEAIAALPDHKSAVLPTTFLGLAVQATMTGLIGTWAGWLVAGTLILTCGGSVLAAAQMALGVGVLTSVCVCASTLRALKRSKDMENNYSLPMR